MILADLVASVYLKATGKRSSLTSSDEKYLKIVELANAFTDVWQNTADWSSQYDPDLSFSGTVTATDTFAIPAAVRKISDARGDYVRIWWTDGVNYTDFDVVPADALKRYGAASNVCAQTGSNLIFRRTFTTNDAEYGGTIKCPVYTYAPTLSGESDVIAVDIPRWLVFMCAAEYVRNDITKQGQYPNIVQEANELMEKMRDDNDAQVNEPDMPWSPLGRSW